MPMRDLIPWTWSRTPARRGALHPLDVFHREIDRLFDEFWGDWDARLGALAPGVGAVQPRVDVRENDKEIRVTAELPGLEEKDVDVVLSGNILTLRGEKSAEKEERDGDFYLSERSFGRFERSIPLPTEVDEGKVEATFHSGVLTVVLPKTEAAREKTKKISIRSQ